MFLVVAMIFVAGLIALPSCKKEKEPEPPPAAYVPVFQATSISFTGSDIDFAITCVTDDVEIIKVEVKYPGGLGNDVFTGPLLLIRNEPFTFPVVFPRLSGTWTFVMTGTIRTGTNIGTSFTATATVQVSGK